MTIAVREGDWCRIVCQNDLECSVEYEPSHYLMHGKTIHDVMVSCNLTSEWTSVGYHPANFKPYLNFVKDV